MENFEVIKYILDLWLPWVLIVQLFYVWSWLKKTLKEKDILLKEERQLLESVIKVNLEYKNLSENIYKALEESKRINTDIKYDINYLKEKIWK